MAVVAMEQSSLRFQESRAYGAGIDLSWEDVEYKVHSKDTQGVEAWRTIVRKQSGVARVGRVLAIMGPSGAGKTTMMNSLCGRVQQDENAKLSGCVYLNNAVLSEKLSRCISFVCQDDVIFGTDTPTEALTFSCRIRTGAAADEAQEVVAKLLEELGLTRVKDNVVGIPGVARGVSGGERKRVNIGCELVTQPPVIFLDEPTTGLDSETALKVGHLLHELAHKKGRTVITTIHSPSSALFECFDDLLLLSNGGVIYHGPTELAPLYFASVKRPVPDRYNPSEYYMTVLQEGEAAQNELMEAWQFAPDDPCKHHSAFRPFAEVQETLPELAKLLAQNQAGLGTQLALLLARSWRSVTRNPMTTVARTIQTVFNAIFVGLFFFNIGGGTIGVQDRMGALFMLVVNNFFMSLMNGIATFPPEQAVYLVEQTTSSYSPYAYFASKIIAEKPFQIAFPFVFGAITYFMIDFHVAAAEFFKFAFVLICSANCANAQGILVAALCGKFELAMAIAPITVLPFFLVGGLFANTERLDPYWVWLNRVSMIRYTYTGLVLNEFGALDVDDLCPGNSSSCGYRDGAEVIKFLGFEDEKWGIQILALLLVMFGLNVIGAVVVARQGARRRANFNFKAPVARKALPSA